MLEEIADEDRIDAAVRQRNISRAGQQKLGVRRDVGGGVGVEIERDLLAATHVVDESAVAAREIEHGVAWSDKLLEEIAYQNLPQILSIIDLGTEPPQIYIIERQGNQLGTAALAANQLALLALVPITVAFLAILVISARVMCAGFEARTVSWRVQCG